MTRTEIIALLDAELDRLERARDYLAAALKGSKSRLLSKVEIQLPSKSRKSRKQPSVAPALAAGSAQVAAPVAAVAPAPVAEPQIHRVPPRRRVERRSSQPDKLGKSSAALSGLVPAGPVAVSATEARKVQERAVPSPAMPVVSELRSEIGTERSLGSLIQAFERRTGLNGAETP